ncbi:MAG: hypothetical protein EZS28_000796 [Streblomastix strix]|uniref:Uncharacterized protein n=1 Tax=Streblomastix strix TaxID=222440 RepID=A0A5J4X9C7_9EUKA|nr:MAG: hypothetical protein EZS28_000796 [Streblomastix strix]
MFESEFMSDIEQMHWWSDGGQHFRNKQLIWALLNDEEGLIPGFDFEVNFTVPYHGIGAPDDIFGMYSTGSRNNMPKEDRFNDEDQLVINDFRKYLNFVSGDNEISIRPLAGIAEAGERSFPMKYTVMLVKRTPKCFIVLIKDE